MLEDVLTWVQNLGAVGAIVYITLYIFAAIFWIPGSLLTLGAGAAYGLVFGTIYVSIGASLGAIAAFLIGRYGARDWIAKRIASKAQFKAIDAAVAEQGWKIVVLTRLSPVFPFTFLNYAFGVSQVSLRDYTLGCAGMIPGIVTYVYLGSLAGSLTSLGNAPLSHSAQLAQWGLRAIGLIATVAVTLYVTRIARKALQNSGVET